MSKLKLQLVIWLVLHLVQAGLTYTTSDSQLQLSKPTNRDHKPEDSEIGLPHQLTKRNTDNGK